MLCSSLCVIYLSDVVMAPPPPPPPPPWTSVSHHDVVEELSSVVLYEYHTSAIHHIVASLYRIYQGVMTVKILVALSAWLVILVSVASAFVMQQQHQPHQQPNRVTGTRRGHDLKLLKVFTDDIPNDVTTITSHPSRRTVLTTSTASAIVTVSLCMPTGAAMAKSGGGAGSGGTSSNISPEEAYQRLLGAREELLIAVKENLTKRDAKGLNRLLTNPDSNVNRMDTSMQTLLESKALDAESKKAIGTIRTYGVGADVMIMYGGLKGEFVTSSGASGGRGPIQEKDYDDYDDDDDDDDDGSNLQPNWGEVQKYLVRTLDSLQEVIVVCRSNGFEKGGKKKL